MFTLIHAREERRAIDAGRVACPLRGRDADIEDCLYCGFAREVAAEASPAYVACRPPRKLRLAP
jgi:hypothetical protein